jgi:hypothetical protein
MLKVLSQQELGRKKKGGESSTPARPQELEEMVAQISGES